MKKITVLFAVFIFAFGLNAQLLDEGFDDITTLPANGWSQVNASTAIGSTAWFQGNETVFPSYDGAPNSYIGANFNSTTGSSTISNWLITPVLSLSDGDEISFYTRTVTNPTSWPDRLEVRLSTAGAGSTNPVGPTGVGSYITLLLEVNPTLTTTGYPAIWTKYSITLSGVGSNVNSRVAFRYFVTDGGPSGTNSDYIGIDRVVVEDNSVVPFPFPYCGPLDFTTAVEPITRVIVSDIDNASSAGVNNSPAHEDFTSITGNMIAGDSYPIALEGNTDGNHTNRFVVFVDWNQNGVLDDPGEVYEMDNTIVNSTGLDGQQALGTIIVPGDALAGQTRMRIKKIRGTTDFLDPCLGTSYGQTEDYTINVSVPNLCVVVSFPYKETFEDDSTTRDCWTQIQEVGVGDWTFATGSSGTGSIVTANSGVLNARFVSQSPSMGNTPITKLVSPVMDLTALGVAEMEFYYGQEVWAGDQNFLKVYYRISDTNPWVEIAFYSTNIPTWTKATLHLPNLSSTYQVAFEGINNFGRANVIDDVVIYAPPPPNDLIENAISVTNEPQPYTDQSVRLQYATNELLNPSGCAITGTNGVWYSFTAAYDGSAEASITSPAGVSAVIFYEAPSENVIDETELTFIYDANNQCAPSSASSIPTLAGQSYYIYVLNTEGSSDVVIDISESLSIDDNTIDGFVFYPNPADNILNLKSNVTIDQVELFTVLGQSVLTRSINANSSQLDISRMSTGVYLMRVTAESQTATYQVIKR